MIHKLAKKKLALFEFFRKNNFYLIIFSILLICPIFLARNYMYFRDYSIIMDGAYRISQGYLPYKDFGIPLGPISFYFPTLFITIFGNNFFSIQLSQLVLNIILLTIIYQILKKINANKIEIYTGIFSFSIFYLILITNPWYNVTAIFFYFLSILFILKKSNFQHFLSGLVCGLCVFTKQDYAFFTIITVSGIIFFSKLNVNGELISSKPKNIKDFTSNLKDKRFLYLFSGLFLTLLFLLFIFDNSGLKYWFNYGQSPHSSRRPGYQIIKDAKFYLSFISIFYGLNKKDIGLLVSSFVLITACFTSQTSGLGFTSGFYIFLIPLVFLRLIKFISCQKSRIIGYLSITILSLTSFSFNFQRSIGIFKSILQKKVSDPAGMFQPLAMSGKNLKWPIIDLKSCADEFKGTYGPDSVCMQIQDVKSSIYENGLKKGFNFLNMSELTPLLSVLNAKYPPQLPLWFHEGTTFFPKEMKKVKDAISNGEYELIAIQASYNYLTSYSIEILETLSNHPKYEEVSLNQYVSPYGATSLTKKNYDLNCPTSQLESYQFSYECEEYLKPIRFFIKTKK